ncbi:MAG: ribose 5-phosphate isomerase B [Bacteroidota bacterium]|nr:ribose 5-phosphate isomerase B [Bacteroidota bacterium]
MKIAISSDHAGYELKIKLISYLEKKGHTINDFGCSSSKSSDYPDYAHPMSEAVETSLFNLGISLCGSGNGINMTANKHSGVRSALCWIPEIAKLARMHNNANVCSLPARFVSFDEAKLIVDIFLETEFDGGRHLRRINKIPLN